MLKSFIGIDVHKHRCVYTELDTKGKILRRGAFCNTFAEVSDFASTLQGRESIVVEPVLNYLWLLDQLESYAGSIHVATPHKVRVIAESKCKTDKYDSRILADLLRTNFLPESYIAPGSIRSLRELLRQRSHLIKNRTMLKNRIRHLLFLNGSKIEAADVSSAKARRELRMMYLPDMVSSSIQQCLLLIEQLNRIIEPLEAEIITRTGDIKEVQLLQTIPGVGNLLAAIIYAEVVDISRFRSRKAFASYTGLTPTVRASGDSIHYGSITRHGSRPLRTALVEAAIKVVRYSEALNRLHKRIQYRSNVQKARVAVARKLATIIYAMLSQGKSFRCERKLKHPRAFDINQGMSKSQGC